MPLRLSGMRVASVVALALTFGIFLYKDELAHSTQLNAMKHNGLEFISSFAGVVTPSPTHPEQSDDYVAICMAVKDQHLDLPEFFQHHYENMGIQHFYVMDDGSDPPLSSFLDTYGVPEQALTFVYYGPESHRPYMQLEVYNHCAKYHGGNHTWMAFIDADEFIDTPGEESLQDILHEIETSQPDVGALGLQWQMHTSNGQMHRVKSSRETYTECIYDDPEHGGQESDNRHVKSVVRLDAYTAAWNPHFFALKDGMRMIGEHNDKFDSPGPFRMPISRDRVALHHYAVKSYEEYEEKILRSNAMGQAKGWGFWDHVETIPHVACPEMARWVE